MNNERSIHQCLGLPDPQVAARNKSQFISVTLKNWDIKISRLIEIKDRVAKLCPPRSGHIGNWRLIAKCSSGPLDFNAAICRDNILGYPLAFDLTSTETLDGLRGDGVHMPGSIISDGRRSLLTLSTYNGREWIERERTRNWFVPMCLAECNGERIPLTTLQRQQDAYCDGWSMSYYSNLISKHENEVRCYLKAIFSRASSGPEAIAIAKLCFSNIARRDGRIEKAVFKLKCGRIECNGVANITLDQLAEWFIFGVNCARSGSFLLENIRDAPPLMPLFSGALNMIIYALTMADYPDIAVGHSPIAAVPLNAHLHWGATQMAGVPPAINGYFDRNRSDYAKVYSIVYEAMGWDRGPLYFVALPAAGFVVCPNSNFPQDLDHCEELYKLASQCHLDSVSERAPDYMILRDRVQSWCTTNRRSLSKYFLSMFNPIRSVSSGEGAVPNGKPILSQAFRNLTLRQACALSAALHSNCC